MTFRTDLLAVSLGFAATLAIAPFTRAQTVPIWDDVIWTRNGELVTASIDGSNERVVQSDGGVVYDFPAFSPDGHKVAFNRATGSAREICVLDESGRVCAPTPASMNGPAWGPDSKTIYYTSGPGDDKVWSIDFTSPSPRAVLLYDPPVYRSSGISASPDGEKLVVGHDPNNWTYNIFIETYRLADGVRTTILPTDGYRDFLPVYSPVANLIVWLRGTRTTCCGEPLEVWLMNDDGTGQVNLTNTPTVDKSAPRFSRDGQWVFYAEKQPSSWLLRATPIAGGAPLSFLDLGAFPMFDISCDNPEACGDSEGPLVTDLSVDPNPIPVGQSFLVSAIADDTSTGGSNISSAEYVVGMTDPAAMTAFDGAFDSPVEDVSAVVPGLSTGVYEVCVRGFDSAGNQGADSCIYVPVFDPDGGFVTGGGWVQSGSEADLENGASGPAHFGFVSKYLPGHSTPDGQLEFRFKAGDLTFKSAAMDWLVVTGEPRAIFRGDGLLNGDTSCKFEVDAWDGSLSGADAFGLKIYACGPGADVNRYSLAPTELAGGSIKIHKNN